VPYFSEFTGAGKLVFDGIMPSPDMTYRAYVEPWVGLPLTAPSAAVRRTGRSKTVYASWNGATQVRSWRVLAARGSRPLRVVADAVRSGFETAIPVIAGPTRFEVQARGAGGRVIGTSRSVALGR
jgi:hypothetical protein